MITDPMSYFASHVQNKQRVYQQAMHASDFEHCVISAGSLNYHFRDDISQPFKVNAYFAEWLPLLSRPDSYLLVGTEGVKLYLKQVHDFWHSPPTPLPNMLTEHFDVLEYANDDVLVKEWWRLKHCAFIGAVDARLPRAVEHMTTNPEQLLNTVDYHRATKDAYEIANMREANRLAALGHQAALAGFRAAASELEIHQAYLQAVAVQDADLPYPNIIALNEHAAVLHHNTLATQSPPQHLSLLIDAGAAHNGYAADITRTYISKEAGSGLFAELLTGVEQLQQSLIAQIRVGLAYGELHVQSHCLMAELLCDRGIITVSVDEALATGLTRVFYPHGLGHLLGIQVHDKGGQMASVKGDIQSPPEQFPTLRSTRTIEPAMVFTVEPGLYFIPMLLDQWRAGKEGTASAIDWTLVDALLPYGGIRIEDNVIVREDGIENMTRDAFKHFHSIGT